MEKALLTKEHVQKRLKWVNIYWYWMIENWAKVVWSDKSVIQKDNDSCIIWVWRHQNKAEKYMSKNVLRKKRDGQLSQMIRRCFLGNRLRSIVFVDGSIKKK